MTDPIVLLKSKRLSLMAQPPSTRHRLGDELFTHLTPATAVDALGTRNGALHNHLAGASAAERDFAIRVAMASQRIWEWLDELSDWHWPANDGGSAGFENPNNSSRALFSRLSLPGADGVEYIGSFPATQIALYERRMDEISREMADLEMEDIKTQVLTNHILPLSRPGTPSSVSGKELSSTWAYTKMDDVSVVVTTMIVQTLPNLAKLTHLLRIWSIRLGVLRRIPAMLYAMEDAQVALEAGWTAISKPLRRPMRADGRGAAVQKAALNRGDFAVMQKVLAQKIAAPGGMLDAMLDSLEGTEDALPDGWLERMEAVEHSYSDWVASCERKMCETEWSRTTRSGSAGSSSSSSSHRPSDVDESVGFSASDELPSSNSGAAMMPSLSSKPGSRLPNPSDSQDTIDASFFPNAEAPRPDEDRGLTIPSDQESYDYDLPGLGRTMSPVGEEEEQDDDTDLPPLRRSVRQGSDASEGFSALPDDSSRFDISFSDAPEVSASPIVPQGRIREAEYFVDDDSPPSSPPQPLDREAIELEDFFVQDFDDSMSLSEVAQSEATFRGGSTINDTRLRQQISNIIDSIPAKIKLSGETPPTVNLNPPDLQLPRLRKKPSKEPCKRSTSSLSSRTTTPSFILSPSRTRPRHTRGQPEVRIYHLSRSTGEAPIKLFIRCVGEHGERVMVRVGGGWADLSEYLKDYASHHKRRSVGGDRTARIEVRDASPRHNSGSNAPSVAASAYGSSPPHRPASSAATARTSTNQSPMTPRHIHRARRSVGAANAELPRLPIRTPVVISPDDDAPPSSEDSQHSRPNSRLSWVEDDSSFLGLAGPSGKRVEMSEENKAWVESVKERVRQVSAERNVSQSQPEERRRFGDLGKVGGTKRVFRRAADGIQSKK